MKTKRAKTGGSFGFFLKEGLINIFVNGFMSFAAVSIIAICILIVSSFGLMALNVNEEITRIQEDSRVMVFIETEYEGQEDQIKTKILAVPDILTATFESKEEALENYKNEFLYGADALDGLEEDNPLRDGFNIELKTLDNIDAVTTALEKIEGIGNVSSENTTFKALTSIEQGVNIISIALMVALGCISIFIISNTVKLAMFARRSEIGIMKMIGATNAFIRWPFVIEGLILGICGSVIAFFGQWFVYNEFALVINEYIGFMEVIAFDDVMKYTAIAMAIGGAVIGVLGSTLTIRKFLDV